MSNMRDVIRRGMKSNWASKEEDQEHTIQESDEEESQECGEQEEGAGDDLQRMRKIKQYMDQARSMLYDVQGHAFDDRNDAIRSMRRDLGRMSSTMDQLMGGE